MNTTVVLTHHYSFQIEVYWYLNSYGGPGRPCLAPWKNAQIPHLRKDYLSKEQSKASKGLQCMLVLINPMQRPSLSTVSALWDLWAWLSFTKLEEAPLIEQWVTLPLSCLCLVPTQASLHLSWEQCSPTPGSHWRKIRVITRASGLPCREMLYQTALPMLWVFPVPTELREASKGAAIPGTRFF